MPPDELLEPPLELELEEEELLELLDELPEEPKLLEPPVAPLDVEDELPDEPELAEDPDEPELPLDPWWGGLCGGLPPLELLDELELEEELEALLDELDEPPVEVLVEAVKITLPLDPPKKPPLKKPPPKPPPKPPLPPTTTAGAGAPPPLNISPGGRGGMGIGAAG